MADRCPTCGAAVEVVAGGEGTSHYQPTNDQVTELRDQLSLARQAVRAKSLGQVHELRLQDLAVVTTERDKARRQVAELREALEFTVLCCCAITDYEGPLRPLELEDSPCEGCERAMAALALGVDDGGT